MRRQLDLFSAPSVGFDARFATLVRHEIGLGAWVDHVPGWVTNHDALFDELVKSLAWRNETMRMYDRTVEVPRLLATLRQRVRQGDTLAWR